MTLDTAGGSCDFTERLAGKLSRVAIVGCGAQHITGAERPRHHRAFDYS